MLTMFLRRLILMVLTKSVSRFMVCIDVIKIYRVSSYFLALSRHLSCYHIHLLCGVEAFVMLSRSFIVWLLLY